jgi:hypothetical protein
MKAVAVIAIVRNKAAIRELNPILRGASRLKQQHQRGKKREEKSKIKSFHRSQAWLPGDLEGH